MNQRAYGGCELRGICGGGANHQVANLLAALLLHFIDLRERLTFQTAAARVLHESHYRDPVVMLAPRIEALQPFADRIVARQ